MIALITPTGARPFQFNMCSRFMKRQNYTGKVAWIIVDDAIPRSTDKVTKDFRENWTIHKVYPMPAWYHGWNTQARNIAEGVRLLRMTYKPEEISAIFIIEDDDYYKPIYLTRMVERIKGFWAAGERNTIYYNVLYRRYIVNGNTGHSSLFQTALTWEGIDALIASFKDKFIDAKFWTIVKNKHLFNENNLAVGMKGMPGRGGIGAGHSRAMNMHLDMELKHLTKLIGNEDALLYAGYYGNSSIVKHDILTHKRI